MLSSYLRLQEVDSYWRKLLEVCAVERLGVRCRMVVPENCARLPAHMSLAAKLLASPRALTRIRMYCKNRPGYIVPATLGGEEVQPDVLLQYLPFRSSLSDSWPCACLL